MNAPCAVLPDGVQVFERGWLSSNNILLVGAESAALVDTGYATHAAQTVALVEHALGARALDRILNTHLHSDHCGGNAALQSRYPGVSIAVPRSLSACLTPWDSVALTYVPTGQQCAPFSVSAWLSPGEEVSLGGHPWQVHGAPGHDPHSVILFQADSGTLISADALWASGFGVVFPELEGTSAFDEVGDTLDVIERLQPRLVIPGHGPVFTDVKAALEIARRRLDAFVRDPRKHATHAAKVLLKFKLLECQALPQEHVFQWAAATPYIGLLAQRWSGGESQRNWLLRLIDELVAAGALARNNHLIVDR